MSAIDQQFEEASKYIAAVTLAKSRNVFRMGVYATRQPEQVLNPIP